MTDMQAIIERCDQASAPGATNAQRRRVLREVAAYLRDLQARDAEPGNRSAVAA